MPESVKDRCTKSHEYIFMLSKSPKYYYDAESIRTPAAVTTVQRLAQDIENQAGSVGNGGNKLNGPMKAVGRVSDKQRGHSRRHAGFNDRWDKMSLEEQRSMGANKRSVWTVSPSQFRDAHFATYPEKLIVDCIKAGCPTDGIVLDPFMGAGTTALVASKLHRNYLGIELNSKYIKIAEKRLSKELGLFKK
jgi:site-specific DNA-methyltransferase (adenine-specific)